MSHIDLKDLHAWCSIPAEELAEHPDRKTPFELVPDSATMGQLMAAELVNEIGKNNAAGKPTRAIIPCGPKSWYAPFREMVNRDRLSLKGLFVFHMDECLDWEGRPLPEKHPYNFRTFMEENFYGDIGPELAVPEDQRYWLYPDTMNDVKQAIDSVPIDITLGGWGQDGHIAYNQARRHPFSSISVQDLENSSIRIQENNLDTILALAQRSFGAAYQFVPPMSVTLGVKECLLAKKVRVYSDTGSWKQTALRVALFGPITPEYPLTLLQKHPDARITATLDTATHPIAENPDWDLLGNGAK